MALAHLVDAGESDAILAPRVTTPTLRGVRQMLERRLNSPMTSSAGRLFDAVAALAKVRDRVSFEGQAAMELEWLAEGLDGAVGEDVYPWAIEEKSESGMVIDTRPLIRAVVHDYCQETEAHRIAKRFHATMAEIVGAVCLRIRQQTGINVVVLSGGVFMNVLLTGATVRRLDGMGFALFRQQQVPPNDGGLSLGQLAIAAYRQSTIGQPSMANQGEADVSRNPRKSRGNLS